MAAFHDIIFIDKNGLASSRYIKKLPQDAAQYLDIKCSPVYTCSNKFYIFQLLRYAALYTIICMIARHKMPQGLLYFDTQYKMYDNTDLWIKLGLTGAIVFDNYAYAQYRIHNLNITRNSLKVHVDTTLLLHNNRRRVNGLLNRQQKKVLKNRLALSYSDLGWCLRNESKPWAAVNAYYKSWFLMPHWVTLLAMGKLWLPAKTI